MESFENYDGEIVVYKLNQRAKVILGAPRERLQCYKINGCAGWKKIIKNMESYENDKGESGIYVESQNKG